MKIDVHAHYIPERYIAVGDGTPDGSYGVEVTASDGRTLQTLAARPPTQDVRDSYRISKRLADMDAMGVDMHMLSVSPQLFDYHMPADVQLEICRLINDAFSETIAAHPSRFAGLAHLPMQAPEAAARELERAVRDLGMRGAEICTNIDGTNLDDKSFAVFWAKAQELDVPIFLHPQNVLAADRLSRYHLINLIGNPTETAVAAASLIFGGVFREFPRLKVYLAHGGGTCPLIRGRWEHGWRVRPEAKVNIQRPPSEYFRLLFFDSLSHSVPALSYLIESVGADRVMMGTDYPADMRDSDPVKTIASLPRVTDREKDLIYGDTARELFKL
ncbi:MAG TPA: amidohydrolase family protein [Dehalococcoidia bacterium]|nr:amidohydrolase family protein [Dehalococcoidia bacterium]